MNERKREEQGQDESRRILERIDQETEPFIIRATSRARDHLTARDAENADWTELWGRRIGRACAVIFAIVLIGWFAAYLTGNL